MFLLFTDIDAFNVWNDYMNELLGLPDDEGTLTYSNYVTSQISDDILGYFDDRCDTSGMTVIDYDQAVEMGFFPPIKI